MGFPMDYPLFQFLYWLLNTAGVGGVVVTLFAVGSLLVYSLILRWISQGGRDGEEEKYTFPTPALYHD